MSIGGKIKELRKAAGWTQETLAKKVGVTAVSIQRYECEMRQPRIDQLNKIAAALQVPISCLVDDEHQQTRGGENVEDELREYKLVTSAGAKVEALRMLATVLGTISEPLKCKKNMRVVIDYDPQADRMSFRYYRPSAE